MQRRGLPIGGRDVTLIQALQLTAAPAPCSHPHAPHTSFPAQPRGGGSHTVPDPTQAAQTYGCVGSCGLVGRWALAASLLGSDTWLSKPHPGLTCLLQRRSVCWTGKPAAGNGPLWPSPGWGFPLEDPQGSHTPNCCSRVAPMGDPTERRVRSAGHRAALLSCSHSWPGATRLLSCRCTSAWQSWRHRDPPFPPLFFCMPKAWGSAGLSPGRCAPFLGFALPTCSIQPKHVPISPMPPRCSLPSAGPCFSSQGCSQPRRAQGRSATSCRTRLSPSLCSPVLAQEGTGAQCFLPGWEEVGNGARACPGECRRAAQRGSCLTTLPSPSPSPCLMLLDPKNNCF